MTPLRRDWENVKSSNGTADAELAAIADVVKTMMWHRKNMTTPREDTPEHPTDLDDDTILERLLELNLSRERA